MSAAALVNIFVPIEFAQHQWIYFEETTLEKYNDITLLHGYHIVGRCDRMGSSVPLHTAVVSVAPKRESSAPNTRTPLQQQLGVVTASVHTAHQLCNALTAPCNIWIHLQRSPQNLLASVVIENITIDLKNVNLIFYNPKQIWHSDCLVLKYNHFTENESKHDSVAYLISKVAQEFNMNSNIHSLFKIMLHHFLLRSTQFLQILLIVPNFCMKFQIILDKVGSYESSTLIQIGIRTKQLKELQQLLPNLIANKTNSSDHSSGERVSGDRPTPSDASSSGSSGSYLSEDNSTNRSCLMLGRLVCVVATDVLLGLLLLHYLLSLLSVDGLYHAFGDTTQHVSSNVLSLLGWIRGAPAGLKLNQPLTRALATFFSYHVGLWMLYLEVASSAVYVLCSALVWCGLLGASVQVALLSDMINVATLHLHCFYVYAARLHMVQVSLLGSQWRAFRGHKWNPLKQRVDSLPNTSASTRRPLSRVLTAVIFTLVVFLLPTTTIYYCVFLTVRLALWSCSGLLYAVTWMIHHNPLYIILLHCTASTKLRGEVQLSSHGDREACVSSSQPLQLRLSIGSCGLLDTIRVTSARLSAVLPALTLPCISRFLDTVLYARQLL